MKCIFLALKEKGKQTAPWTHMLNFPYQLPALRFSRWVLWNTAPVANTSGQISLGGGAVEWKLQLEFSVSFRPHCHRNTPWKAQKHRKLKVGEDLYLLGIPSPAPHGRPVHHPNFCSAALKPCCSSAQASARTLLCRMLRQSVYCVWSIGEHWPPQCWCEQG